MDLTPSTTRIAIVLVSVLLVSGCGLTTDDAAPSPSGVEETATATTAGEPTDSTEEGTETSADETATTSTDEAASPNLPLDALGAVDAALAHQAGVVVVELDLEEDDSLWEATVLADGGDGIGFYIDVTTGEVIRESRTALSSWQRTAPAITASEAIGIALQEKPGTLTDLDLDRDDGRVAWEAVIEADDAHEWDLYIDPQTGEILRVERDD